LQRILRCVDETCILDALEFVVNTHLDASYGTSFRENIQRVKR
jgi:hypothetical protein